MIKKALMGLGILSLGTVAVLGWDPVVGYFKTSAEIVKTSIEDSIPFEVEVTRLEGMIDELNSVVRDHTRVCMERQVDYELLVEELDERAMQIKTQKTDLMQAQTLLQTNDATFVIAEKMYSRDEVNQDTIKRLEMFESDQKLLNIRRETTETLASALKDANGHLEAMKLKRSEYSEMLQILRANHMQLEARKQLAATVKGLTAPEMDNEFGDVAELFNRLNKRIKVENQMIDSLPVKKNFKINYSIADTKSTPVVLERLEAALGNNSDNNQATSKIAYLPVETKTVVDGAIEK
jgi:hypothetical protein